MTPSKQKARKRARGRDAIDASLAADAEQYHAKMSKACDNVRTSCERDSFWTIARIAHVTRAPLDHLSHWLMTTNRQFHTEVLSWSGISAAEQPGAVCQLVWFKAKEIADELQALLCYDKVRPIVDRAPEGQEALHIACWVSAVLHNIAAFHYRFVQPCSEYPRRLFLLIKDDADVNSRLRREEASWLLLLDGQTLEANTRKIRRLLRPHLQRAEAEGTLDLDAYSFLYLLALLLSGDTQETVGGR